MSFLVTPLSLLPGTQPLMQLVRGLRGWAGIRLSPAAAPAAKSPNAAPADATGNTNPPAASPASGNIRDANDGTSTGSGGETRAPGKPMSHVIRPPDAARYMTLLATTPNVASELFDDTASRSSMTWTALLAGSLVTPDWLEKKPASLRERHRRHKNSNRRL